MGRGPGAHATGAVAAPAADPLDPVPSVVSPWINRRMDINYITILQKKVLFKFVECNRSLSLAPCMAAASVAAAAAPSTTTLLLSLTLAPPPSVLSSATEELGGGGIPFSTLRVAKEVNPNCSSVVFYEIYTATHQLVGRDFVCLLFELAS